jgi:hypothetical protein
MRHGEYNADQAVFPVRGGTRGPAGAVPPIARPTSETLLNIPIKFINLQRKKHDNASIFNHNIVKIQQFTYFFIMNTNYTCKSTKKVVEIYTYVCHHICPAPLIELTGSTSISRQNN